MQKTYSIQILFYIFYKKYKQSRMVKHIKELVNDSFYFATNLYFKQRKMDKLFINYRKDMW